MALVDSCRLPLPGAIVMPIGGRKRGVAEDLGDDPGMSRVFRRYRGRGDMPEGVRSEFVA